jgi:hypothetical protein
MTQEITVINDALTQVLLDAKLRGKSYAEIASENRLPIESVIAALREVYNATTIRDPIEHRALLQLRIEKIIDKLWDGLEQGSFKHGEAILKGIQQLQELHDLNEKTINHNINVILDEDAAKVFEVLKYHNQSMYNKVIALPLSTKAKAELVAWPEWAAESATEAVQNVIYAEVLED